MKIQDTVIKILTYLFKKFVKSVGFTKSVFLSISLVAAEKTPEHFFNSPCITFCNWTFSYKIINKAFVDDAALLL